MLLLLLLAHNLYLLQKRDSVDKTCFERVSSFKFKDDLCLQPLALEVKTHMCATLSLRTHKPQRRGEKPESRNVVTYPSSTTAKHIFKGIHVTQGGGELWSFRC